MRLINSRQAWHDAYYPNIKSTTAFSLEALQLGIVVKKIFRQKNNQQVIHQWLAGKVQHCISSLPASLQCFGHYLYSPLATSYDLEVTHGLVWSILSKQLHQEQFDDTKQKQTNGLIRVALKRYQILVVNEKDQLHTPIKIINYLRNNFQITLQKADWKKEWQPLYNKILFICSELDKKALSPINHLIKDVKEAI